MAKKVLYENDTLQDRKQKSPRGGSQLGWGLPNQSAKQSGEVGLTIKTQVKCDIGDAVPKHQSSGCHLSTFDLPQSSG